jgi:cell division protein FtsW (lipid II flippase)
MAMSSLIIFVLIVGYAAGIWKFWKGFSKTNFQPTLPNRLVLALLWPALFIANPSYRQNFRKALKGR